ncbi:YraN family protein [Nisaea sp.]|uniref:YraN family protein n=1 Tax=Nisaea sp. TaxID=2024842 RepID=UPI0025CF5040|nr:YraN family protein [Nisaea sp.]
MNAGTRRSADMVLAKRRAQRFGLYAEAFCRLILRLKGYRIIATRLRTKVGEIDILAERGQTLAIVEVKARPDLDTAQESVTHAQWRRLQRAALWVQKGNSRLAGHRLRFDLFAVAHWRFPRHIQNVWIADHKM